MILFKHIHLVQFVFCFISYSKFAPTANSSSETECILSIPLCLRYADYGSEDIYDLPPGIFSFFSDSPDDEDIINFSGRFSPENSPSSIHVSIPSESLDEELNELNELIQYIDTPVSMELSFLESSKGGSLSECGFSYTELRVVEEVTKGTVFSE